ncbi:hypothetical protein [Enterococcus hulanensis]|uniref:hypothetical protein n=1 Tax=Enterococcus hulanensis TaxID=2559929 RepID=UPI0010F74F3A|nr:hypothetical protein [Enterococcus hulanensis]
MKKLIGTLILGALAVSFAGTVQADDQQTDVTYEVENSYTLKIPAKIDLQNLDSPIIGTAAHNIKPKQVLKIQLGSANSAIDDHGTITLTRQNEKTTAQKLTTQMFVSEDQQNPLKKGIPFFEAKGANGTGATTELTFAEIEGEKPAGTYNAAITFTASVEDE